MLIDQQFLTIYYLWLQDCLFKATVYADGLVWGLAEEILICKELSHLKNLKGQQIGRTAPPVCLKIPFCLQSVYSASLESAWAV